MSQISRQRRFKRAALLTKRTQCLGRYPRNRGCMASYEHLRSNNSCLAKALSKQKEKKQLLFSQNVALLAEVQDLSSACIKRDNTIIKVLQNAREMLKMLVTLTKFVTNTIASCQEYTSSTNTNVRLSCNPFSKGENRRLSVKTPTKGIVKPMVSGHTITKPTINLSRVNMQHYNNSHNLSTIEEVSTPVAISPPNSNANDDSTSTSVSLRGQPRNADGRICRMPERLNINSPRASDGDERRLSQQKSRHSGKPPERRSRSKSNRLSQSMNGGERPDLMTSVRVTLNDVSNWLQNSPTINIRRLSSTKYNVADDNIEINDSTNNISNRRNKNVIIISKRQLSTDFSEENSNNTIENNSTGIENEQPELNVQGNNRDSRNDVVNENDPLEGPSWLLDSYNSNSSLTNTRMESSSEVKDCNNKSDDDTTKTSTTHTMQCNSSSDSDSYTDTDSDSIKGEEDNNESNHINCKKITFKSRSSKKGSVVNYFQKDDVKIEEHDNMNKEGFVTRQRGNSTEAMDDDLDDFTLMHMRGNVNNVSFNLNDLRLPVLENTIVESIVKTEEEPEMTTMLENLPENSEIPLIFNNICNDDSLIDRNTVTLPQLSNTAIDCTIPVVDISLDMHRQTKLRKTNQSLDLDHFESITSRKAAKRKEKKSLNDKDPSTAKVVLQKLPHNKDFHLKSQPFSLEETLSQNSSLLSDSESSTGSIHLSTSNDSSKRPKRQKAPQNFKEPNLRKKLRRFK
ncbi:PREDICTED: bromodomain-containing protein DDB_G0270170-like isoform X1 [Polistes canadensis]|uniref:bromodomain-containing protein DDB_G0270170-like isoform X1 n=1 Tax=Polistes canadensis TaxID=91411 RepID=UPI000718C3C6|nr:PREDICTED: bromodomain-containing protein DDB_G0270170-like isoform X1 [Polistes canadensis]XP_014611261.1 PREDICTED: bromodomain-containing protein DDB_G0270170-like isoform X1 [Polistes canadensis]